MTSTTIDPDLRPVSTLSPYEQGRKDRIAGRRLASTLYLGMDDHQQWQEGWLYQDAVIERAKRHMRKAALDIPEEEH
jgi:hypothetical protein